MINVQTLLKEEEGGKCSAPGIGTFNIDFVKQQTAAGSPHPSHPGSDSDSNWAREELSDFYVDTGNILDRLTKAAEGTKGPRYNDFKPEVALQKKYDALIPAMETLEQRIVNEQLSKQNGKGFAESLKVAAKTLTEPKTEIEALRRDMASREIREGVRAMSDKQRGEFLAQTAERGDIFSLKALSDSIIPVYSDQHAIDRAIEQAVSVRHPWIERLDEYHAEVAHALTLRSREVIFAARAAVGKAGIDYDKLQDYRRTAKRTA